MEDGENKSWANSGCVWFTLGGVITFIAVMFGNDGKYPEWHIPKKMETQFLQMLEPKPQSQK